MDAATSIDRRRGDGARRSQMRRRVVQASTVDPRTISLELEPDAYRVYFHDADGASDEWRLTEAASVVECLEWADRHADDRTYVLYVEIPRAGGERLLARLSGTDPNET
ncbi:hypothetical protein [uncultured Leifsonia sp.]|uniref:hypothetical protein n=1 Tax=uncultured Leifsonia sp. TaxID=340359 RepID=UPI000925AA20|nr:hypothetical protein [uncultured Leifsonia sp.]OJX77112.1 MAG: hypothetical protein BGO91_06370 [Leifsonia sp. 71-9]